MVWALQGVVVTTDANGVMTVALLRAGSGTSVPATGQEIQERRDIGHCQV